jgi:hypothetical protein
VEPEKKHWKKNWGCASRSSVWTYKRKSNRDATGMLRIILGQTLDTYEEFCACFIDWQKAFWLCKLDQINADPKVIDWHERRLFMDQSVKQGCCFLPNLFNLHSQYLTKEGDEGFRDFRTGQVVCKVKHAEDVVLLAKEETVLQGTIHILTEIGGCYEWKWTWKELK